MHSIHFLSIDQKESILFYDKKHNPVNVSKFIEDFYVLIADSKTKPVKISLPYKHKFLHKIIKYMNDISCLTNEETIKEITQKFVQENHQCKEDIFIFIQLTHVFHLPLLNEELLKYLAFHLKID